MEEKFKNLKEVNGYEISNMGYIRNKKTGNVSNGWVNRSTRRVCIERKIFNLRDLIIKYFFNKNKIKNYIGFKNDNPLDIREENISFQHEPYRTLAVIEKRKNYYSKYIGKKHHKSRPFKIDNKKYNVLREASTELNIPLDTIKKRLVNKNIINYHYIE